MDKILVAGYRRVSTKSLDQAKSYEDQDARLREFVDDTEKYELYDVYQDEGLTGTALFKRKDFVRLIKDAGLAIYEKEVEREGKAKKRLVYTVYADPTKTPKFRRILVKDTSRFARNVNIKTILDELLINGIAVDFIDKGKSIETQEDLADILSELAFDEKYSRDLSRKLLAGNLRSAERGVVRSGYEKYGYKYIPRERGKITEENNNRLVLIPHEALVIRQLYRLYAGCWDYATQPVYVECDGLCDACTIPKTQGIGYRSILQIFRTFGYKTRKGSDFTQSSLKHLLENEKHCGLLNNRKFTHGTVFNQLPTPAVRQDYVLNLQQSQHIEAIIQPTLYLYCLEKAVSRSINSKGKFIGSYSKYKGRLYCGNCKGPYVHTKSNKYHEVKGYYTCKKRRMQGKDVCPAVTAFDWQVDAYITQLCATDLHAQITHEYKRLIGKIFMRYEYAYDRIVACDTPAIVALDAEIKNETKVFATLAIQSARSAVYAEAVSSEITRLEAWLTEARDRLTELRKTPDELLHETQELTTNADKVLSLIHSVKPSYTLDELWEVVDRVIVYGQSKRGNKTPDCAFVPVLHPATLAERLVLDVPISLYKAKRPVDISYVASLSLDALQCKIDGYKAEVATLSKSFDNR